MEEEFEMEFVEDQDGELEDEHEDEFEEEQELEEEIIVDLSQYTPARSKSTSRGKPSKGVMSIINSKNNGKRITLAKEIMVVLGHPEQLQFAFGENEILIGNDLLDNGNYFEVNPYGLKGVIYSANLVREITELFNFDFSNKVSITLEEVDYIENGETKAAIITIP